MAKVNAAQWLQKWGQNLNAAGTYIQNGVNAVSQAPGVAAAAAQDRMLANLTAAVTSGVWARNVAGVSLGDWKAAMVNKGLPRIAQGVTAAQKNKTTAIQDLLTAVDASVQVANATPRGNLQQNIQRAVSFMSAMSQNAPKRKGA